MAKQDLFGKVENSKKVIRIGIDAKGATEIAINYFLDTYSDAVSSEEIGNVLLEELEKSEDEKHWYVTVGFDHQVRKKTKTIFEIVGKLTRRYKLITIDSTTGKVISMKIRQV